jgi:hypothetical protein
MDFSDENIHFFIETNSNESVLYFENFKIIKLTEPAYIYSNQIRNKSNNIYINSVTVEMINHTKDSIFIPKCNGNYGELKAMYDDIHNVIKNSMYLYSDMYCRSYYSSYSELVNKTFTRVSKMNKNIFFCNHQWDVFGHTLIYFYQLIYCFYILKKYIPDLLLVIIYESTYTTFLLKMLNITDYIIIDKNEQIINDGNTFFADMLNINMTENVINNYYYDLIVKNAIDFTINCAGFPKKIVFMRKPDNISSPGYIHNRQDIINITNKYGYVDIDQTKLDLKETIQLLNNATHLILETGGSIIHLLWTKNIKSIILNYRPIYFDTLACLLPEVDKILHLTSDNALSDIVRSKKTKIITNDDNYIKTGIESPDCYNFTKLSELIIAIEKNEV